MKLQQKSTYYYLLLIFVVNSPSKKASNSHLYDDLGEIETSNIFVSKTNSMFIAYNVFLDVFPAIYPYRYLSILFLPKLYLPSA